MSSCTDCQSEDHNGVLQSRVALEDTRFIMCIVIVLAPCCRCLPQYCRLSFTRLFVSLISLSVMGRSVYQGALPSLACGA